MTFADEEILTRYARLAPRYDRAHARWLRFAGGEAQCAFEGAVTARVRPGTSVLDVGCGTGALARRLSAAHGNSIELTLVDASRQMLARAGDIAARHVHGEIENLPLPSNRYDVVICA